MYRIKRIKSVPNGAVLNEAVHWAASVDRSGAVDRWVRDPLQAGEFDAAACSLVEEQYRSRPKAGAIKFVEQPVVVEGERRAEPASNDLVKALQAAQRQSARLEADLAKCREQLAAKSTAHDGLKADYADQGKALQSAQAKVAELEKLLADATKPATDEARTEKAGKPAK